MQSICKHHTILCTVDVVTYGGIWKQSAWTPGDNKEKGRNMPIRTTEGGSLSCQLLSATSWGSLGKMQTDFLSHILSGYAGRPQSRIHSLHFQMRP